MIESELIDGVVRIRTKTFSVAGEASDEGFASMESFALSRAPVRDRSLILAEIKQLQRNVSSVEQRSHRPTECYWAMVLAVVACIASVFGLVL